MELVERGITFGLYFLMIVLFFNAQHMAVPYTIVSRVNPGKPKDPVKYYASAKSSGEISIRDLAKEIAEISTMSLPDVIGVLESVVMLVPRHIGHGKIIRLGELGSLRISLHSEGMEKPEEVSAKQIKSNKFVFTPGKDLQKALKNVEYVKAQ